MRKFILFIFAMVALNATTPTYENVTRLYVATFDRTPDVAGLKYWVIDSGLELEDIARSFFDQPETKAKYYPDGTIHLDSFVDEVYANLFDRTPDSAGRTYWIDAMYTGKDHYSTFILAVINGAQGNDAVILADKTKVAMDEIRDQLPDIDSNATFAITANGKYGAIEIREKKPVTLRLHYKDDKVNAGTAGQLVVVDLADKVKYYNINQRTFVDTPTDYPLSSLQDLTISLGSNLPVGAYAYYFGSSLIKNGTLNTNAVKENSVIVYVGNTFSAPIDPDKVITAENEDGIDVRFPVDEAVIFAVKGTSADTIKGVVQMAGGTLVGQVPSYDLYQAKFLTTTQNELDTAIAQLSANPSISFAMHNVIAEQTGLQYPPDADINTLQGSKGCPFSDIEYAPALALFEGLKSEISLSPVHVAVIESGVDMNNSEFSQIKSLVNLSKPGEPFANDVHGTAVLGVIAAANDGKGVNGLASRILGDNLKLSLGLSEIIVKEQDGSSHDLTYSGLRGIMNFFAAVKRAKDYTKASIINISANFGLEKEEAQYARGILMMEMNDLLFVASLTDKGEDLNYVREWPATSKLSNVITVGGTDLCKPTTRWVGPEGSSPYGPGIDIVAPAEDIPTADGASWSGNSFSTPMVTSLAAIIKSIDPSATPTELKGYIQGSGHPMPDSQQLGKYRLSFLRGIYAAIVVQNPDLIIKYIEESATTGQPQTLLPPLWIIEKLYGSEESCSIEDIGSENFPFGHSGEIYPSQTGLTSQIHFGNLLNQNGALWGSFSLEADGYQQETPMHGRALFVKKPIVCEDEASIEFLACEIIVRPDLAYLLPMENVYWIKTAGKLRGNPTCYEDGTEKKHELKADFTTIIKVYADKYSQYLEKNCEGGIIEYSTLNP